MTVECAENWLRGLVESQPIDAITIHGGEPFLHFDLMKKLISEARALRIPRRGAITNGYWAESKVAARAILRDLKSAGLNRITFSLDGFHQEFVPLERARAGIEAALELEIGKGWVDAYLVNPENPENPYDRSTSKGLNACSNLEGVECAEFRARVEGRAADRLLPFLSPLPEVPRGMCRLPRWLGGDLESPGVVEIDPEGNVTLCPGLCIGNARAQSIGEILETYDYRTHPIIRVIAEKGPVGLLSLARSRGYKDDRKFVDECHLCYEMRRFLSPHYSEHLVPTSVYFEGNEL
jgi:MoaA/NifB/PqqE/SkfB family radical SAM enzyme